MNFWPLEVPSWATEHVASGLVDVIAKCWNHWSWRWPRSKILYDLKCIFLHVLQLSSFHSRYQGYFFGWDWELRWFAMSGILFNMLELIFFWRKVNATQAVIWCVSSPTMALSGCCLETFFGERRLLSNPAFALLPLACNWSWKMNK